MAIPADFFDLLEGYDTEIFRGLRTALAEEPTVAIRFNRSKIGTPPATLSDGVAWCERGRYLESRPQFTFEPLMHQGAFYVQDASSMFISHVIKQLTADGHPIAYLDACAAPGGKTTAAIDALPAGSTVVANEYNAARANILRENATKWGYPMTIITQGDTARFRDMRESFDIIAADVPCSGEGMMRKDPQAVEQWSRGLIKQCTERQREIIDNLWQALRPGGYLIYSTCTFNRDENEEIVHYILDNYDAESVTIDIDPSWGIAAGIHTDAACYRFTPGLTRGEGLFMAVVRKQGESDPLQARPTKVDKRLKPYRSGEVAEWVNLAEGARLMTDDATVKLIMPSHISIAPTIDIATIKGRNAIPTQALAMSQALNRAAFDQVEVDRPTAIDYLRRQAITLPDSSPRGHILLTYRDLPLGFAKNLGNRANNLYPEHWRILSQRDPSAADLPF